MQTITHNQVRPVMLKTAFNHTMRSNRVEPRVIKRRPKTYQLITKPRRLMRVSKSRIQKQTETGLK